MKTLTIALGFTAALAFSSVAMAGQMVKDHPGEPAPMAQKWVGDPISWTFNKVGKGVSWTGKTVGDGLQTSGAWVRDGTGKVVGAEPVPTSHP